MDKLKQNVTHLLCRLVHNNYISLIPFYICKTSNFYIKFNLCTDRFISCQSVSITHISYLSYPDTIQKGAA